MVVHGQIHHARMNLISSGWKCERVAHEETVLVKKRRMVSDWKYEKAARE
jgi:hypothetical protein